VRAEHDASTQAVLDACTELATGARTSDMGTRFVAQFVGNLSENETERVRKTLDEVAPRAAEMRRKQIEKRASARIVTLTDAERHVAAAMGVDPDRARLWKAQQLIDADESGITPGERHVGKLLGLTPAQIIAARAFGSGPEAA
jgi:hypothetical protein